MDTGRVDQKRRKLPAAEVVPWLVFLLLILGAGGWYVQTQRTAEAERAAARAKAKQLGLPDDFPLDVVPLEQSLTVDEVETGEATSREGEPMKRWTVSGHSRTEHKALHEFYRRYFMDREWMQTQMISIPTGQSADYATEAMVVHLEIERPKSRQDTSFKMDVYKLVGQ